MMPVFISSGGVPDGDHTTNKALAALVIEYLLKSTKETELKKCFSI
jgi:hypothetical protein